MRLGGVLESMAARRASGILTIVGDPAGTIYFDQGQITCAQASWIPDIGARLLGVLGPGAGSRDLLASADEPDRDIGTFLVQRNHLTVPELAAILRSVVVDTVITLTSSAAEGGYISDIRFTTASTHWAAAFSCQDVDSVLAEAGRRAGRMARFGLGRGTPVRLHDLGRPSAVLSRTQWALACAIDQAASAHDLAWRCGLAFYDVIENIGELIAAGLCARDETAASAPPGPLAEWFGPAATPATLPPVSLAPLGPPASRAPGGLPVSPAPPEPPASLTSAEPPAPLASPRHRAPASADRPPPPATPPPVARASARPASPGPAPAASIDAETAAPLPADRTPATPPVVRTPHALPRRARPASGLPVPAVIAQFSAADMGPLRIEITPAAPDLLRRVLEGLKRS
jgi:hypothetical protein